MIMKKAMACLLAAGVVAWFVTAAEAQMSPVRLKVNKISKKERKATTSSSGGETSRRQAITETVFYTVEVSNFSSGPVRTSRSSGPCSSSPVKTVRRAPSRRSWRATASVTWRSGKSTRSIPT